MIENTQVETVSYIRITITFCKTFIYIQLKIDNKNHGFNSFEAYSI